MPEKVGIRAAGVVAVHLPDTTGNYATLCGMDGDDPGQHVEQTGAKVGKRARVDCERCTAIWKLCRTYQAADFVKGAV